VILSIKVFVGPVSVPAAALALLFGAVYGLTAWTARGNRAAILCVGSLLVAGFEATFALQLGVQGPLLAASALGLAAVAAGRWGGAKWLATAGRGVVVTSGMAGALLAMNRGLAGEASFALVGFLVEQALITGLAAWLTRGAKDAGPCWPAPRGACS
jgi:hypothetical protein